MSKQQKTDLKIFKLLFLRGLIQAGIACLLTLLLGLVIFNRTKDFSLCAPIVGSFILFFVVLAGIWLPVLLSAWHRGKVFKHVVLILRSVVLVIFFYWIFPHHLVFELMKRSEFFVNYPQIYALIFFVLLVVIFAPLAYFNSTKSAFRNPLFGLKLAESGQSARRLGFDVIANFAQMAFLLAVAMWMLCHFAIKTTPGENYIVTARKYMSGYKLDWRNLPSKSLFDRLKNEAEVTDSLKQKADISTNPVPAGKAKKDSTLARRDSSYTEQTEFNFNIERWENQRRLEAQQQKIRRDALISVYLAWFCASFLIALFLMLFSVVPYHLIRTVLLNPIFHDTLPKVRDTIERSNTYAWHYFRALQSSQPIVFIGGVTLTMILLLCPIILKAVMQIELFDRLVEPDMLLFAVGLFIAWFSPMILAVVNPDETFGEYFNHHLADLIINIQNHTIFIGYGNLGKRMVDRELQRLDESEKKRFFEIITPDLQIETLCDAMLVIEEKDEDFIFSGTNDLLGNYGVVGADRKNPKMKEDKEKDSPSPERILVPVLQGHAGEPFVFSRVNLRRARLLISMAPEEHTVQAVFNAVNNIKLPTIICVARDDQLAYLTYLASRQNITLLYPKFNQGLVLGQRLWAAILKMRAINSKWPKILIVGNSKSNHYVLETLWTHLPGNHKERVKVITKYFAFIAVDPAPETGHPILRKQLERAPFDFECSNTFITSLRYPYSTKGINADSVPNIPTRIINTADVYAIEHCLWEHKPDILLINDDEIERSLLMLLRSMRALERLRFRDSKFRLPLILATGARFDESEMINLGDASRFYDSMSKVYREKIAEDATYPRTAVYDRDTKRLRGDSISDSLSNTEEMIAGIRDSLFNSTQSKSDQRDNIEINVCLPNVPKALATYFAGLAGLQPKPNQQPLTSHLPSFYYLRNIRQDSDNRFALNGFAVLVPSKVGKELPLAHRIFANDGTNHAEFEKKPKEHKIPGVLEAIEMVMKPANKNAPGQKQAYKPTVEAFYNVLFDPKDGEYGDYRCPGMTTCPIANYQDYIIASNKEELTQYVRSPGGSLPSSQTSIKLAENYYCACRQVRAKLDDIPKPGSYHARILCDARHADLPGILARTLGCFVFWNPLKYSTTNDKWRLNIQYFNHYTCQNSRFTLNRLFGYFEESKTNQVDQIPIDRIRIIPIGPSPAFREWYGYARELYQYLEECAGTHTFQFECERMDVDGEHSTLKQITPDLQPVPFEDLGFLPVSITIRQRLPSQSREDDYYF